MMLLIIVAAVLAAAVILAASLAVWFRSRRGRKTERCETGRMVKGHLVQDLDACDDARLVFTKSTKPALAAWHELAEDFGVSYTICGDTALGYARSRSHLPWVADAHVRTDERGFSVMRELFETGRKERNADEHETNSDATDPNGAPSDTEEKPLWNHRHERCITTPAGQRMMIAYLTDTDVFEFRVETKCGNDAKTLSSKECATIAGSNDTPAFEALPGRVVVSFPLSLTVEMERVMPQGSMPYARYASHPRAAVDDAEIRLLDTGTCLVEFEGVEVRAPSVHAAEAYAAEIYGAEWWRPQHPDVDAHIVYPTVLHAVYIPWNRRTQELLEDTETFDRTWLEEQQRSAPVHWEVRLWTYERLRVFCEQYYPTMWTELWRTADRPVQVVDTLRMLLVYHFGGASVQYGGVWMRRDWDEVFLPMQAKPTRLYVETYFPETEREWTKNYRITKGVPDDRIRLVLIYSAMPRSSFMWNATCVAVERIRKHTVVEDYDVLYINGNTMFSSVYDRCSDAEKEEIELVPKQTALALFEVRSTGSWRCNGNKRHKLLQKRKKIEAAAAAKKSTLKQELAQAVVRGSESNKVNEKKNESSKTMDQIAADASKNENISTQKNALRSVR